MTVMNILAWRTLHRFSAASATVLSLFVWHHDSRVLLMDLFVTREAACVRYVNVNAQVCLCSSTFSPTHTRL